MHFITIIIAFRNGPRNQKTTKIEDTIISTLDIRICSDECLEEYGKYSTPYNTCVKDCTSSFFVKFKNLIKDENNKQCVCENLFYRAGNEIKCTEFPSNEKCKEKIPLYPIPLYGTNECLDHCSNNRILNPSEDICYETGTNCTLINSNTQLDQVNGKLKCDCSYKFYYNGNQKICLGKNDICQNGNKYYIPDEKQCINECPSEYVVFNYYCLNECPRFAIQEGKTCSCGMH